MLELTKHQNNVGQVLQDGSKLINSGLLNQNEDAEVRKQMKLLNDMWEGLRIKAVDKQAKLHETLMKLQTEQLNQMDAWLQLTEKRIASIEQLADSLDGLKEQKNELARLQDDLIKEQEAVDCLKQIIVVVDDTTEDQSFSELEYKLTNLSDRWSNVCKFVSTRWHIIQDLINKLQNIDTDFNNIQVWINEKSIQLKDLILKIDQITSSSVIDNDQQTPTASTPSTPSSSSTSAASATILYLIKILKEIEIDMQKMHSKLNEMNDLGEQISLQLNNSPQLTQSLNNKMDTLETKWNELLYDMEYLSKKCNEQHLLQQQIQQQQQQEAQELQNSNPITPTIATTPTTPGISIVTSSSIKTTPVTAESLDNNNDLLVLPRKEFNYYINQLYKVFNKIAELINSTNDVANVDEQQDINKV